MDCPKCTEELQFIDGGEKRLHDNKKLADSFIVYQCRCVNKSCILYENDLKLFFNYDRTDAGTNTINIKNEKSPSQGVVGKRERSKTKIDQW